MKSRRSKQFRALFAALPKDVQEQAQEAYRLFEADPSHPSLHFSQLTQPANASTIPPALAFTTVL